MASIQFKKGKNGKKTFYVVISHRAGHKWIKAGSIRDAKILKKEIERLSESRRFESLGLVSRQKRIDDFFLEYADYIKLRNAPSTVKRYLSVLNTFVTFLKLFHPNIKGLSQITPDIIEAYQSKRLQSLELKIAADGDKTGNHKNKRLPKPQTVNNEVVMLACSFNWGVKRGLISSSPTKNVSKLRELAGRQPRLLTIDECKLLIKTAQTLCKNPSLKVYANIFSFLLNTGLRSGELCNLTWNDIDLKNGLIRIQPKDSWTPKTFTREFYLNETSLKILRETKQENQWIFTNSNGNRLDTDDIRRILIKIARIAGIDGLTRVHDLRHTFSSHLQMNGVDAATVAAILGHKDLTTTMIYTHQTQEHLKSSINRLRVG